MRASTHLPFTHTYTHQHASGPLQCQVGPCCVLGEDCVIGDKSSVKRSVIGHGCRCGICVLCSLRLPTRRDSGVMLICSVQRHHLQCLSACCAQPNNAQTMHIRGSAPLLRLGAGVKVINSVLMDGTILGDGCHVQMSVLCAGATLQERVSLKDCQVCCLYDSQGTK